jgi:hypothetical protein
LMIWPPPPTVEVAVLLFWAPTSVLCPTAALGILVPEVAPLFTRTNIQTCPVFCATVFPRVQVTGLPGPAPETAPLATPGGPKATRVVLAGTVSLM